MYELYVQYCTVGRSSVCIISTTVTVAANYLGSSFTYELHFKLLGKKKEREEKKNTLLVRTKITLTEPF